ncbi:MAG: radical SAM protein [Caldilineaceae bacterium]|nr:radical SAM protein [Caldilineaceae bacterium]
MNESTLNLVIPDPARNKSNRHILLVEPNYHNKYPPLGLMKLSSYHRMLGDSVVFFKGRYSDYFFIEKLTNCLSKIRSQGFEVEDWSQVESLVSSYLKQRRIDTCNEILGHIPNGYYHIVKHHLNYFAYQYVPTRKWDRVYVTTLFTFYWNQTIEAIEFAKKIVKSTDSLFVGGVAASLIPQLIAQATGLQVGQHIITGLLDKPGILDDNEIIIDEITPDYSVLETIDHHYPLDTGYLTYMTKGCTRTCSFCAVPKLEPIYKEKISIEEQIARIKKEHGERKDLILMDNNVLGSPRFPEIIEEIMNLGFVRGAKYIEPNRFEILTNYLVKGDNVYNERKYMDQIHDLLQTFRNRIKSSSERKRYDELLNECHLNSVNTINKETLLDSKNLINEFVEKYRNKSPKQRYIDFNQGIDCRYVNEENMALLSQLPIRPMRIAFDYLALRKPYENAIRLADKYGVRTLSNYILFNYQDKPAELWERLKINLDLNSELEASVYSFPMKFIPLYGEEATNRQYIGKHWNRKYIRAIQCILHVTKGVVTVNPDFFNRAFGSDIDEFFDLLVMPESYIMYRNHFEENGQTEKWRYQYRNLSSHELAQANEIIFTNSFSCNGTTPKTVRSVLEHYQTIYVPERIIKPS